MKYEIQSTLFVRQNHIKCAIDFISIRIKLNKYYLFPTLLFNLWIRERSKASCIRGTTGKDERSDKTASIFVYEETIWKKNL